MRPHWDAKPAAEGGRSEEAATDEGLGAGLLLGWGGLLYLVGKLFSAFCEDPLPETPL